MFAFVTLTAGAGFISFDAHAAVAGHPEKANGKPSPQVSNPYSPRYQHEYRHGAVPTIPVARSMKQWALSHATQNVVTAATNLKTLSYGGGVGGVGVVSGQAKVYLVFYGNQWGGSSTDANGNLKFANDAAGAAGAAQQMFKGIGTNGETWQNELTQWCNAASGATSCATGIPRIQRQSNIVAGVWYDNVVTSPSAATGTQLAQEAIRAAAHFGNTAAGSNTSAYYVIMSPKGTNPDAYQGKYCAWHDYTGDGYGVTAPGGDFAFSNQPYNIDSGAGCGVGFVNSGAAGTLDGYTMTLGHEWHETMSDWFPAGGWTNHDTGTYAGQENSDECAWIAAGSAGGAANITFSTGTFAQQASWSNDTNSCAISHADVSGGGGGGGGGGTVLSNGVAKTGIAGAAGSDQLFTLVVPSGATGLKFVTSGGTGDADLYVKFGSAPTTTTNDCKSEGSTTAESCSIATAQAGTYYVLIHGYATFSGVSLTGSYSAGGGGGGCTPSGTTLCSGSSVALPSVSTGGVSSTYSLAVPAGKTSVVFSISGGTGDADLYVNFGSAPTSSTYTCRPYLTGNSETCTISSPTAGTYYANVRAYAGYSGVTLRATISP
jgi:serine protease